MDASPISLVVLSALSIGLAVALRRRRRATRELLHDNARLRAALQVGEVGVFDHDMRTGMIDCSAEFFRLWGSEPDGPITLPQLMRSIHAEERDAISRAIARCHDPAGPGLMDVQQRVLLPDGRVRWVAVRAATTFEGEGSSRRAVRTIGTATDCTARRTLDEALHQVMRVAHIGIFEHDMENDKIEWSDEQRENFGFPADEPLTLQKYLATVHPDDVASVAAEVTRAQDPAGVGVFDLEYRLLRPDGAVRWNIVRGRVFFSGEGESRRPVRSIGAALDVTDRHHAEAFLHRRERIHSAVVSQSTEGIALIDSTTLHFVEFNDAACGMLGYSREAFGALTFPQLAPDADTAARVRAQIAGAPSNGGDLGLTELKCRNGTLLPVWLTGRPVSHDERVDLALVWRDIAGIKQAEAEFRRLNSIHRTLSHTNQLITRSSTETEVFLRICDIAVEDAGFALAWIGLLEPDGSLRPVAVSGPASAYVDGLRITIDEQLPEGRGPAGQALRSGSHVVVNHIAVSTFMDCWQERAGKFGIESSAAFALRRNGAVAGVLSVYSADRNHFGVREIALLDDMAADISFGLDGLDRSAQLQRSRALVRDIEATVHIGSFRLTLESHAFWWSDGAPAVLGLEPGTAADRHALEAAFEPEIALMLIVALTDAARFGNAIDIDLPLRNAAGAGRWIRLSGIAKTLPSGETEISGTLQDVSDLKRLESEVMSAAEAERRRLASELHDNLGQLLFGTSLLLGAIAREARASGSALTDRVDEAGTALHEALDVCRNLAHGAAPNVDRGLATALQDLAARINRTGVLCTAHAMDSAESSLGPVAALELYRIAQEAITNALKHAQCRHIHIDLGQRPSAVVLTVTDDGTGIDCTNAGGVSPGPIGEGIGLRTMRYRAARAGGTLELRSTPSLGTTITACVPMTQLQAPQAAAPARG